MGLPQSSDLFRIRIDAVQGDASTGTDHSVKWSEMLQSIGNTFSISSLVSTAALASAISTYDVQIQESIGATINSISNLQSQVGLLEEGAAASLIDIDNLTGLLSNVQDLLDPLPGQVSSLVDQSQDLQSNISSLTGIVTTNQSGLDVVVTATGILETNLGSVTTTVNANQSAIAAVMETSADTRADLDTVTALVTSNQTSIATSEANLTALIGQKADVVSVYTKTETDSFLADRALAADVYTKDQVDTRIGFKADAASVYTKAETDAVVAAFVGTTQETLDSIAELANAIGNDENFAVTVSNQIGQKADIASSLAGYGILDAYTKAEVSVEIDNAIAAQSFGSVIHSEIADFAGADHGHHISDLMDYGIAGGYLRSSGQAWVRSQGVPWSDLLDVPSDIGLIPSKADILRPHFQENIHVDGIQPTIWLNEEDTSKSARVHMNAGHMIFSAAQGNELRFGSLDGDTAEVKILQSDVYYSVWHQGNDGSNSGLDADLLDGLQGEDYAKVENSIFRASNGGTIRIVNTGGSGSMWRFNAGDFDIRNNGGSNNLAQYVLSHESGRHLFVNNAVDNLLEIKSEGTFILGNEAWHAGNDGSGSGLDADLLDGLHASALFPRSGNVGVDGQFSVNRPSDFWSHSQGAFHKFGGGALGSGWIGTNGSFALTIASNAYRNASSNLSFLDILGISDKGSQIDLHPNGQILFYGGTYSGSGVTLPLLLQLSDVSFRYKGHSIYHTGNDGAGSGLDADLVDGQHGQYYLDYGNFINTPTIPPAGIQAHVANTFTAVQSFASGIDGFDLSNGINGSNFNISGVNILSINDAGEGITFIGNNTVKLYAVDDGADNIMNFDGAAGLRRANFVVWDAGNDGSGSGLDADLLDGLHASSFLKTSGMQTTTSLRLTSTSDLSLTSTAHGLQIGASNSTNLAMDNNEIMARSNGSTSTLHLQLNGGTVNLGSHLVAAGNITANSDKRLKKDIETLKNSLSKLMGMRPVSFVWNDITTKKGSSDTGFIAQEMERIAPETVVQTDIHSMKGVRSVDYGRLVTYAIGAIQEQQKMLDELLAKVSKLEASQCGDC